MITVETKVRKITTGEVYTVIKLFGPYAEIDKDDKSLMESISNMTEYIYLNEIEEYLDESKNRG